MLWIIDGQTGRVKFNVTGTGDNSGGPVMLSETGALVAWSTGSSVMVINGSNGAIVDNVAMGCQSQAEISDDGMFLACAGAQGLIWAWNAGTGKYASKFAVTPPGGQWIAVSTSISADGTGAVDKQLASFAWITESPFALGARVTTCVAAILPHFCALHLSSL